MYIFFKMVSWAQIWALSYVLSQPLIMQRVSFWLYLGVYCTVYIVVVMLNKIESYSLPHPKENCLRCEIGISASCFVMCLLVVILQSVCVVACPMMYTKILLSGLAWVFYFIVSPLLNITFHYHHNHILLFFYHLYIYNKSFAFIVYVQINIYYLIMLSCVCPIRLG